MEKAKVERKCEVFRENPLFLSLMSQALNLTFPLGSNILSDLLEFSRERERDGEIINTKIVDIYCKYYFKGSDGAWKFC